MPTVARKVAAARRPGGAPEPPETLMPIQPNPQLAALPLRLQPRLVVGVDYGTTRASAAFLAVADAERGDPSKLLTHLNRMHIFDAYGRGAMTHDLPTLVMYEPGKPNQPTDFGFSISGKECSGMVPEGAIIVSMAKLLLHDSEETKEERERLRALAEQVRVRCGYEPDFIADFLRMMRESIFEQMRKSGCRFTDEDIEWVLSVPAAWTEDEQAKMWKAADRAGMHSPTLVSEPESAALVVLVESAAVKIDLKDGDIFIVCDGGGGTVDIMTYYIVRRHPLQLKEAAVGGGALCGSTYLDKRFEVLLQEKLDQDPEMTIGRKEVIMREKMEVFVERYKTYFKGPESAPFVAQPYVPNFTEKIVIKSEEITTRVFDPIVSQIADLLQRQITESTPRVGGSPSSKGATSARVKSIILTGGLGGNPYLHNRLIERFDTSASPEEKITILRPLIASTAAVRGGTLLGIHVANVVTERKCRFSYGFDIAQKYDKRLRHHRNVETRRDSLLHEEWVDTVVWVLKKGDSVKIGDVKESGVRYRDIAVSIKDEPFTDSLIVSEDTQDWPTWKGTLSNAVETYMLVTKSSGLPWETFPTLVNEETGERFYRIFYNIYVHINPVNSATIEVVHQLPGGGEHRQLIPQLVKCDRKAASLQTRQRYGAPCRISPHLNKRKTPTEPGASMEPDELGESVPQPKPTRNQAAAKKAKPSQRAPPKKKAITQKAPALHTFPPPPTAWPRTTIEDTDRIQQRVRELRENSNKDDRNRNSAQLQPFGEIRLGSRQEERQDDESTVDLDEIYRAIPDSGNSGSS